MIQSANRPRASDGLSLRVIPAVPMKSRRIAVYPLSRLASVKQCSPGWASVPVDDFEAGNAAELAGVVGDEKRLVGDSSPGDERVDGADWLAPFLEGCPERGGGPGLGFTSLGEQPPRRPRSWSTSANRDHGSRS